MIEQEGLSQNIHELNAVGTDLNAEVVDQMQ